MPEKRGVPALSQPPTAIVFFCHAGLRSQAVLSSPLTLSGWL